MTTRLLAPVLLLLVALTAWRWHALFTVVPEPVHTAATSEGGGTLIESLSLILDDDDSLFPVVRAVGEESPSPMALTLSTLDLPPWTRFSASDVSGILEATKDLSTEVEAVAVVEAMPEEPAQKEDAPVSDEPEIAEEPASFPLVYGGFITRGGAIRAILTDERTGTSYFRRAGEKLARFTVAEITAESVLLLESSTQRRIMLRTGAAF